MEQERIFFETKDGAFRIDWAAINGHQLRRLDTGVEDGKKTYKMEITLFIKDSQPINLPEHMNDEYFEFLKSRNIKVWSGGH